MEGSPTLSISQCVTLKLSDTNYLSWKLQFEQFLSSQMLMGYVTGDTPRPAPTISVRTGEQVTEESNPDFVKWIRTDQLIKAWIFGSLSEEALKNIYGLGTSHEVWSYLAKKYNRVSATRKLDLQRRIQTTAKLQKPMAQYLSEIKFLCDQLDSIGCPISEHEKIYGVLNGLGKEYESICTVIEDSMDKFPSPCFEDVVFKLTGFDDKLQTYDKSTEVTPHMAFHTDRGGYSNSYSNNRGGYVNRGRGRYRGNFRGRGAYSTRGRGFQQQFASGSSSDSRPTYQICGRFGNLAFKCYNRFDPDYQPEELPTALAAIKISDQTAQSGHEWYPDTGATAHITNSAAQVPNAQPYHGEDAVIVGNGEFLPITHIGSAVLPTLQGQMDKGAPHSRQQK
uniref:Retrovirus-related Pol polyprotein from transposon TNT 1-94 n=1 Tax=Noccaea caerulescens TaxID=107243 RepID=A0A1J3GWB8_NOCCA